MKQIVFIGLLLLSFTGVVGQRQNVDSLVNMLNKSELSNKEQMDLCYQIANRYVLFDLNKASEYAEKGLNLSEKEKNMSMASKFNVFFGRIYNTRSSYDTASVYWNKALELAVSAKDKEQEASVHVGIGIMYARQEEQTFALEHFINALSIYESIGNKRRCLPILGNIGSIYRALDNNERAIYYLEKAKNIAEELEDADGKMQSYYELSAIYCTQKDYEPALKYAREAYENSRMLDDRLYRAGIAEVLSAVYYEHLKDYDAAWKYADECLQLAREMDDQRMVAGAWKVFSNLYFVRGKYKDSEMAARKALEIDSTSLNININLLENMLLADILLGKKEEAVAVFHRYKSAMDKHTNQNNREILADMDVKYETEKREMRIVSLEKERRLYVWLGIAGVLSAIAFGIVFWQKMKNARKEKQLIATRSVLDGEMSERSRLARDLHDRLSGNLSAVKMGLTGHKEGLQNICDKLDGCIDEIRRVAHNLMPASLQYGMKVAIEDFVSQFPDVHFHFFGKEERIEDRLEFVVYCCANELITNSLRHSGSKNINVQLIQDEKHVSLTVQDDGCGFDEKSVAKGIGLKNIRDRVASCNGKMDIVTLLGKGTETTIDLKIENV